MSEEEIMRELSREINASKPKILKKVLKKCKEEEMITLKRKTKFFAFTSIAIVMLCAFGGIFYGYTNLAGRTTLEIDVNPSIGLVLNKKQKVVSLKALNSDAKKIVDGMDFIGSDYKVAVNALVGSMLKNGYITDLSNSILLSVEGKNKTIEDDLMAYVNSVLKENNINGAIVGQTMQNNKEIESLAKKYNISLGKATLISQIIAKDKSLTWDNLVKLNINELNLISAPSLKQMNNVKVVGDASTKAYIGDAKAINIALSHAGISSSAVKVVVADLDSENGIMVYEVDFTYNGFEYDYEINATSGAILKNLKEADKDPAEAEAERLEEAKDKQDEANDKKNDQDDAFEKDTSTANYIDKTKAKLIAINHAGIASANILEINITFDKDNKVAFYEVDFETKEMAYDYKVDAISGKIIEQLKKAQDIPEKEPVEPVEPTEPTEPEL
ncbi:MAG: PepSY domain-containing protein [Bacilli bacterium]